MRPHTTPKRTSTSRPSRQGEMRPVLAPAGAVAGFSVALAAVGVFLLMETEHVWEIAGVVLIIWGATGLITALRMITERPR